jgi:hypothetical protein
MKEQNVRILALDRPLPGATLEKYQPHLVPEVRYAWAAYKAGAIRDIYFRQDRPGVAIFLECASLDEAKTLLADFPLARAGLIDFEVIPLGSFTNWEVLFSK